MNTKTPALQIRNRDGIDWLVAATWPNGIFEEIRGFKSKSEANEWIAKEFQAWLDERSRTTITMPKKHPNTRREGGPGASHENKKQPLKMKPFAELNTKIKGDDPRPKEQGQGRREAP